MNTNTNIHFENEKEGIYSLFKRYFVPTLLGYIVLSTFSAVDGFLVGHRVGIHGLAAVNIVAPVYLLITGLSLMVGFGTSVVASVYLSKGKIDRLNSTVIQSVLFLTLLCCLITISILLFPEPIARALGCSSPLLPLVKEYLLWFSPSCLFLGWFYVTPFLFRLDGSPKFAMFCCVITACLNILLDWLFLFKQDWGLRGAALATSISAIVGGTGILFIFFFSKHHHFSQFRHKTNLLFLNMGSAVKQPSVVKRIVWNFGHVCSIGFSVLLEDFTMLMLILIGNRAFLYYMGDEGVSAYSVICYFLPFVFVFGNAISHSVQPIISYSYGRRLYGRIAGCVRLALLAAVVCSIPLIFICALFSDSLEWVFVSVSEHSVATGLVPQGFSCLAWGILPAVCNFAIIGCFQSVKKVRAATILACLRGFVLLVPCYFVLPHLLGRDAVWLVIPIVEWVTLLLAFSSYICRCFLSGKCISRGWI